LKGQLGKEALPRSVSGGTNDDQKRSNITRAGVVRRRALAIFAMVQIVVMAAI
jgi:hypothetical protein